MSGTIVNIVFHGVHFLLFFQTISYGTYFDNNLYSCVRTTWKLFLFLFLIFFFFFAFTIIKRNDSTSTHEHWCTIYRYTTTVALWCMWRVPAYPLQTSNLKLFLGVYVCIEGCGVNRSIKQIYAKVLVSIEYYKMLYSISKWHLYTVYGIWQCYLYGSCTLVHQSTSYNGRKYTLAMREQNLFCILNNTLFSCCGDRIFQTIKYKSLVFAFSSGIVVFTIYAFRQMSYF